MAGIDSLFGLPSFLDQEYGGNYAPNDPGVYSELSRAMPMNYGTPGSARGNSPTSADIARAYQMRAAQSRSRQMPMQSNPRPQQTRQDFPQQNMPLAAQYADLMKDPAGMQQQMAGVGNTIGNALRENSDAMTAAGIGPLAPYSEKNPGPYNYMGPAMYGGESADKLAKEKAAMFPSMGGGFGGFGGFGGGMMGGGMGMGYIPSEADQQRYSQWMDNMGQVQRRQQQNAIEAFQNNMLNYPAYAKMFGSVLNGVFGGNRQQFPTSFTTNYGASGGMTQPQQQAQQQPGMPANNRYGDSVARNQPSMLNQVFRRY